MPMKQSEGQLGTIHHYVPQSYLRLFAAPGRTDHVYAYEIDRDPYLTNVKNIAGEKDFYTFTHDETKKPTAELEEALAETDGNGINIINKLLEHDLGPVDLDKDDKANLLLYIAFLYTRNKHTRRVNADFFGQASMLHLQLVSSNPEVFHKDAEQALGDEYEYDRAEKARQSLLDGDFEVKYDQDDDHFMSMSLMQSKPLYGVLATLKHVVLVGTNSSRNFITSDNPVTRYAPDGFDQSRGLGHIDAIFQLPISPTRCILLLNEGMKTRSKDYLCTRENVDHMNWYTYNTAEKWIFAHIASNSIGEMFKTHNSKKSPFVIDSPFNRKSSGQ